MKRAGLFILICCVFGVAACKKKPLHSVDIFYTADIQGFYWPRPEPSFDNQELGGFSVLKNFLNNRTTPFLLIDGGNWYSQTPEGVLTQGASVLPLIETLPYEVSSFTGKDLMYGWSSLQPILVQLNHLVVASNMRSGGNIPNPLQEYAIIERGGIKLGLFGLVNRKEVNAKTRMSGVSAVDEIQTAKETVDKLREEGVQFIILLSSIGSGAEKALTDAALAEEVGGIDLILSSNMDRENAETDTINDTFIVYPGSKLDSLAQVTLFFNDDKQFVKHEFSDILLRKDEFGEDEQIAAKLAALRAETARKLAARVTSAPEDMDSDFDEESALGNLLTDCLKKWSRLDGAILNSDSIREGIKKGVLTEYDLYKVYPYSDNLTFITIKGAALKKALEASLTVRDHFPQVSGITAEYNPNAPSGHKIKRLRINGVTLQPNQTYRFVVTDHIMAGGFGHDEFINSLEFKNTFVGARSIMRSCLIRSRNIIPPAVDRWEKVN